MTSAAGLDTEYALVGELITVTFSKKGGVDISYSYGSRSEL